MGSIPYETLERIRWNCLENELQYLKNYKNADVSILCSRSSATNGCTVAKITYRDTPFLITWDADWLEFNISGGLSSRHPQRSGNGVLTDHINTVLLDELVTGIPSKWNANFVWNN